MRRLDSFAKIFVLAGLLVFGLALSAYAQNSQAGQVKPLENPTTPDRPAVPYAPAPAAPARASSVETMPVVPMTQASPSAPAPVQVSPAPAPAPVDAAPAAPMPLTSEPKPSHAAPAKSAPAAQRTHAAAGGRLAFGALLPLSGPMAAQGRMTQAGIDLAVEDVNAYLAAGGVSERVSVQVEDTAGSETGALEKLKSLAASGIHAVIGPYSDDEVDGVLGFATANDILLLSPGSAGPYLAKPGRGNLLRFAPSDAAQAEAVAAMATQDGATQLITIWAGSRYGDEIVTHVKGRFTNLGGKIIAGTRFKPETTQFSSFVADLKAQIEQNVKDKKKLAIFVAARGDQTAAILREASKIPALAEAKWYGCDDAALRGAITQDPDVAKFAAQVRMVFARYGETVTPYYSKIEKRIEDRVQAFVDTQAVAAYDITWLTAIGAMTSNGPAGLKKVLPMLAERTYGATGWMALDENGDRRGDYAFDLWTIQNTDGKFYWVRAARFQADPSGDRQLIVNGPEK